MCISSLSIGVSTIYPMNYPSKSNWLSMPIQQDIQTDPKGYPIYPIGYLTWRPVNPGGFLHCHPDLHSGTWSCIICGFGWAATVL